MNISALSSKLHIRPGDKVALLNPPSGKENLLAPLPEGANVQLNAEGVVDLVLLFVQNRAQLATWVNQALNALDTGASLWVAYPKQSSKITTDLNRDQGWQSITEQGFRANASIAIDATWSAVRFQSALARSDDELVTRQYSGARAAFLPLYEQLVAKAQSLGDDVQLQPRQSYVAFARSKQFALVKPARDRLDLALKLPNAPEHPRLLSAAGIGSGSMTHRVVLTSTDDIDDEVTNWLDQAYHAASK